MEMKSGSKRLVMRTAHLPRERRGKPVTNQVTTAPDIASRNATRHDSTVMSSCGNQTPNDRVK
jgi:hypothetical protein